MRMAPCPLCNGKQVNNFKRKNRWYSICFNKECGFTTDVPMFTRKMARYQWNRLYENKTGNKLPDEMTGRLSGSFMKKEIQCGIPELVDCMCYDEYLSWKETHDESKVTWIKEKGKSAAKKRKKAKRKQSDNNDKKSE